MAPRICEAEGKKVGTSSAYGQCPPTFFPEKQKVLVPRVPGDQSSSHPRLPALWGGLEIQSSLGSSGTGRKLLPRRLTQGAGDGQGQGRAVSLRGKVSKTCTQGKLLMVLGEAASRDLQTRCSKNRGYPIVPPLLKAHSAFRENFLSIC